MTQTEKEVENMLVVHRNAHKVHLYVVEVQSNPLLNITILGDKPDEIILTLGTFQSFLHNYRDDCESIIGFRNMSIMNKILGTTCA